MDFEHVKVVIVPADAATVAVMHFVTTGRGSVLPPGAHWIADGWWSRPPLAELIEQSILKWRQIGAKLERPAPLSWRIVADGDVPEDRTYRNAWVSTGAKVEHDMVKAKELHRDLLRNERTEKLLKLDAKWMEATRTKDTAAVADIDAEKVVLLDATRDSRIDAALTIEDLKAVTLVGLVQEAQARGDILSARTIAVDAVP